MEVGASPEPAVANSSVCSQGLSLEAARLLFPAAHLSTDSHLRDHPVARFSPDHVLDVRTEVLLCGRNEEVGRLDADCLVLGNGHADRLCAVLIRALAHPLGHRRLNP